MNAPVQKGIFTLLLLLGICCVTRAENYSRIQPFRYDPVTRRILADSTQPSGTGNTGNPPANSSDKKIKPIKIVPDARKQPIPLPVQVKVIPIKVIKVKIIKPRLIKPLTNLLP